MQNPARILETGIKNVDFGDNVTIVQPCNLYGCKIGNNCFIGPFVEIQNDVAIGDNTKVQSHSFICSLVTIGEQCFIGHGVMFINDPFLKNGPAQGDKEFWRETVIGDNVSIGSNATILSVKIASGTVIGAGAVVTKDIDKKGVYAGNPAKLIKEL